MMYVHDTTGREITTDTYLALPSTEQQSYRPRLERRSDSLSSDMIDIGIEAATFGIVLGDFAEDTHPDPHLFPSGSFESPEDTGGDNW